MCLSRRSRNCRSGFYFNEASARPSEVALVDTRVSGFTGAQCRIGVTAHAPQGFTSSSGMYPSEENILNWCGR